VLSCPHEPAYDFPCPLCATYSTTSTRNILDIRPHRIFITPPPPHHHTFPPRPLPPDSSSHLALHDTTLFFWLPLNFFQMTLFFSYGFFFSVYVLYIYVVVGICICVCHLFILTSLLVLCMPVAVYYSIYSSEVFWPSCTMTMVFQPDE
jgi:hypothetical protein